MSGLTTHVLDLTNGIPGAYIKIELYQINQGRDKEFLREALTNREGRLDTPLLTSEELRQSEYELVFYIGDYFKDKGGEAPSFLTAVPVRFGVSAPSSHYHVPLLISPWGYQVYRGS
ncbi:hydroxyisourate hydrolase [Halobacillus sp. A5]|uniref:hydroxyisourate hydrolase n=1 Tax=Halobacillus sp. A5 TaxID=2880263 RepID=UPI0020A6A52B|nr:hydroxyisourate hydrolase [Halobacillus sp. A5]MCP3028425.1 hydroxyisourate hydrolase [Halobacillus sp. A5]